MFFFLFFFCLSIVMLNYREKYGKDPSPSERGSEKFKVEASAIIKKFDLENKINHLVEYVFIKTLYLALNFQFI